MTYVLGLLSFAYYIKGKRERERKERGERRER
jgi:hypothetical protein